MAFKLIRINSARRLLLVFSVLAILMTLGAYVLYTFQKKKITTEVQNSLASVAQLKVQQIANWRNERLGNAQSVAHNGSVLNDFHDYLKGKNRAVNYQAFSTWFRFIQKIYHYQSIILLDGRNRLVFKTDSAELVGDFGQTLIKKVYEIKKPLLSDLHKSSSGVIHIDLLIPLFPDSLHKMKPLGVVFCRIDPNYFLFPLIRSWPTPSPSSETVLFRKETDRVLVLNELRNRKNTALNFSVPLKQTDYVAVQAALGHRGSFKGVDYRGIKVLSHSERIPDSPWYIVTKVDSDEIFAPLRQQAMMIFLFTIVLIALTGTIVFTSWKLQLLKLDREKEMLVKHFDYLVKYTNDVIVLGDLDGNITEVNEKAIETYQYSRQELIGKNITDLREDKSLKVYHQMNESILRSEGALYEITHQKKDGTVFPVEVSTRIIEVAGEKCIQAVIRDISERKAIEQTLRESEEVYRRLVNSLPDIIIRCDLDGNVLFVNDSHVQSFQHIEKEELLGRNIFSFIASKDLGRAFTNAQLMLKRYLGPIEYELIFDNDNRGDFEVNGDVLLNQHGTPYGMVFIIRNITEQKIFQESLRQAKEQAEESDRLKSAFLANMSHEIRTPMNGILGFSELLDDDQLSAEDRLKYIRIISDNSRHLLGVVNDIIDISKIDCNQLTIVKNHFNLNALMDDLLLTYQQEKLLKEKGYLEINVIKTLSDEESEILSDDIRLRQILFNLLSNALKFTKQGFIEFGYVRMGEMIQFKVQDSGKGIPQENQRIIFERFRQEEDSYTRYFGGSGLGLSISKGLVELLGGRIWLESKEGEGSTFYFTIRA